jgi:adenosylmethionine-8-amino-7-oxononanoate aminotransferase
LKKAIDCNFIEARNRTMIESKRPGSVFYRAPRQHYPLAVSASGMYIHDSDGRSYLDMSGGAAVSCLGHGHPDVLTALQQQLQSLAFAHTAFFTNEPQEQLADRLVRHFGDKGGKVYFLSGGSEANETALKLAWQYWAARGRPEKKIIVSREHSYHGNTLGALSASGNPGRRRASAAPLLEWPRIEPCYAYREKREEETLDDYASRAANALQAAIDNHGSEQIAAFIAEPVVGTSLGVVPAVAGYFERIREICTANDILLIADEIMCGSGRTGHFFAHRHFNVRPDIVTLAKGIGGGYQPLAAVVLASAVADELENAGFAHGHTYVGHAAACAAGVAVLDVMQRDELLVRTRNLGAVLDSTLRERFASHEFVGDIRSIGLFAGIELVRDRGSKAGFSDRPRLAEELRQAAMEEGLVCYPGSIAIDGKTVPHVMLAPPMIATAGDIEEGIERLSRVIDRVLAVTS